MLKSVIDGIIENSVAKRNPVTMADSIDNSDALLRKFSVADDCLAKLLENCNIFKELLEDRRRLFALYTFIRNTDKVDTFQHLLKLFEKYKEASNTTKAVDETSQLMRQFFIESATVAECHLRAYEALSRVTNIHLRLALKTEKALKELRKGPSTG